MTMRFTIIAVCIWLASGCGQTGDLFLPGESQRSESAPTAAGPEGEEEPEEESSPEQ